MKDKTQTDLAFSAHKREQTRRALSMTMSERLAWLERALDEMGAIHGIARRARLARASGGTGEID